MSTRIMTNAELVSTCIGIREFYTDQYLLRPFRPDDLHALHSILSSADDTTWQRVRVTPEYSRNLLSFRLAHYAEYGFGIMALENPMGMLIGQAGLQVLHEAGFEKVELVVFLKPEIVRSGIGTMLSRHYIRTAAQCGLSDLYATVRPDNVAARALIAKLGFQYVRELMYFGVACGLWRLSLE